MGACHSIHAQAAEQQLPPQPKPTDAAIAASSAAASAVLRPAAPQSSVTHATPHSSPAAVQPCLMALDSKDAAAAAECDLKAAPARVPLGLQSRTLRQSSLASGWRFDMLHQETSHSATLQPGAEDLAAHARRREQSATMARRSRGDVSARGSASSRRPSVVGARRPSAPTTTSQHASAELSDAELLREVDALLSSRISVAAPIPLSGTQPVSEALASARRSARERTRSEGAVIAVAAHPLLDELTEACAATTLTDDEIAQFVLADHATTDSDAEEEEEADQGDEHNTPELLCVERSASLVFEQAAGSPVAPVVGHSAVDDSVADCCSGWLSASSSGGLMRPCTRLVCVRCSQQVVWLDGRRWSSPTAASYLFLRTHHPSLVALHPATVPDPLRRAYACQCAAADVDEEAVSGMHTRAIDDSKLQWRCGGGHARRGAAAEETKQLQAQARLLQELRHRPAVVSSAATSDHIAALRPSAINFDDDDDNDDVLAVAVPAPLISQLQPSSSSRRTRSTALPPFRLPHHRVSTSQSLELNPFTIA